MIVRSVSPEYWSKISEQAHLVAFGRKRLSGLDRVDYALIIEDDQGALGGYVTVHEIDGENCYWQFGGAFPGSAGTAKVVRGYLEFLDWAKRAQYKSIFTLIENTNTAMLKLAMKVGFRIVGVRFHDGHILVEHRLTF